MKNIKKATIEELLKAQNVNVSNEMYYDSVELNMRFDFERVKTSKVMDIMTDIAENKIEVYEACLYLIYISVPMLRNQQLQEKYKINGNPYEVVEHVFNSNVMEINQFGTKILNIYGFTRDRINAIKK